MKIGVVVLLAVLLGVLLAAGHHGSDSSDEDHGSSGNSAADHDDDGDPPDEKDHDGGGSGRAGAMKETLQNQGLHVADMGGSTDDDCAAHSYGEVHRYFADHPCAGLERAWYEVDDGHDDAAVVSVAWVEMPDAESAADLQRLVDRPGTGNVTELSREDGSHSDVDYTGSYYRSGRDGDRFHDVQAEPLTDSDGSRELARQASGAGGSD